MTDTELVKLLLRCADYVRDTLVIRAAARDLIVDIEQAIKQIEGRKDR